MSSESISRPSTKYLSF